MAGMFSPEMMKMAQEQMAKIPPEQLAMHRQVRGCAGLQALLQAAIEAAPREPHVVSPPRVAPSSQCRVRGR